MRARKRGNIQNKFKFVFSATCHKIMTVTCTVVVVVSFAVRVVIYMLSLSSLQTNCLTDVPITLLTGFVLPSGPRGFSFDELSDPDLA